MEPTVPEQWRNWEEVVLDDMEVLDEVQHLGLCAARAVYHAMNLMTHCIEHLLYDGSVGTGWAEHQLASIEWRTLDSIGQLQATTVDKFLWHGMIV